MLAVLGLVILTATASFAQTWNAASDWGITNPSGQWSYMYHYYGTNGRGLLDWHQWGDTAQYVNYSNAGLDAWEYGLQYDSPVVLKNVSGSDVTGFGMVAPAGKVLVQPSNTGWGFAGWDCLVNVVWTAPAAGTYTYNVTFTGRRTLGSALWTYVYKDYNWPIGQPDALQSMDTITANGQSFSHTGTINLLAGQTFDFLVNNKDSVLLPDNWCQIDATVSLVPEPGTLFALGTGIFGLAGFAFRRRK